MRRFFDYNFGHLDIESEADLFAPIFNTVLTTPYITDIVTAPLTDFPLFANIDGTPGDDTLNGTADADTINGFAGNDIINGLGGDDILNGGDGDDTIDGGNGMDVIDAGAGDDTIIIGSLGADIIDGGAGFDIVTYDNTGLLGSFPFFDTPSSDNSLNIIRFDGTAVVTDILTNVERFEQSSSGVLEVLALQLDGTNNVLDLSTEAITGQAIVFAGDGNDTITAGSAYDGVAGTLGPDDIANILYGGAGLDTLTGNIYTCLLYTSPSPRDATLSRMPSSA